MEGKLDITRNTIIADVLREYPQCIDVFDRHGMLCRTCMGVDSDTIADGAMMHDVDVDVIISELRKCCSVQ